MKFTKILTLQLILVVLTVPGMIIFPAFTVSAAVLHVGDGQAYATISDAHADASAGDTIVANKLATNGIGCAFYGDWCLSDFFGICHHTCLTTYN